MISTRLAGLQLSRPEQCPSVEEDDLPVVSEQLARAPVSRWHRSGAGSMAWTGAAASGGATRRQSSGMAVC